MSTIIAQTKKILVMLKAGPITAMDALQRADCFRLAARIKDLRESGHTIETEMIKTTEGKRIARYHLVSLAPSKL